MLNHAQVAKLRSAILENSSVSSLNGITIGFSKCKFDDEIVLEGESALFYPPERIFGMPFDQGCLHGINESIVRRPADTLVTVRNAQVIGNTAVLCEEKLFCPGPVTKSSISRLLSENESGYHGFLMSEIAGDLGVWYARRARPNIHRMNALFLHNIESGNYGSFLFRQLPQLSRALSSDLSFDCLIVPERTNWLMEILSMLGLSFRYIFNVREIAGDTFESVTFLGTHDAEGFLSTQAIAFIDNLKHKFRGSGGVAQKLYVSRRLSTLYRPYYRPVMNEDEIESIATENGYFIFHPETQTLQKQIETFASAQSVIGPSGSGMLNAMFADEGSRILDMESTHNCVRQHAKIYSSTRKSYAFLFGNVSICEEREPMLRSWTVDKNLFIDGISWASAG